MDKKQIAFNMHQNGKKVKEIATTLLKSISTIYKYINEVYEALRTPEINTELKQTLLSGDLDKYINALSYKDVCLLKRKFKLSGTNKTTKINSILTYFKTYSLLGIYPNSIQNTPLPEPILFEDYNQQVMRGILQ